MHLFAKLLLDYLEKSRKELLYCFEHLTPQQWRNKIYGEDKIVYELASHILSDSERLSVLAPIVGISELFPKPTIKDQYVCFWTAEKVTLSPENILAKSRYERNKLRTLFTLVRDKKQAKELYESNFQTGWHERIHLFDLQEAVLSTEKQSVIQPGSQIALEFIKTVNVLPFLYDIDEDCLDEVGKTNQTYRNELKFLASNHFITRIHKHLQLQDHLPVLKGNPTHMQYLRHIHSLHNDMVSHLKNCDVQILQEITDGKPLNKRLMKVARDFWEKAIIFKKINLRDSWARETGL